MENSIEKTYEKLCFENEINFETIEAVNPYDNTTLFCPAGMQKYKGLFLDKNVKGKTFANIQSCIRLNDLDSIGDGTHLLYFNMIGLFSFRSMTVASTIDFFVEFLRKIDITPSYVTIHPDKTDEWSSFYDKYGFEIRPDSGCIWSDGNIGGYCTEFYVNDIEIGNIVNPMGDCIDVGFGLERLKLIKGIKLPDENEILKETVFKIIKSGYYPSNKEQGYVLRKLLRTLYKNGTHIDHEFFEMEVKRQERLKNLYNKLKNKNQDKSKEWWFDTHGINIDDFS